MKWTEEELDILMLCIKSELTRSATIERCVKEGIMRSDGAISKKRLELKRTLEEEEVDIVDDVVEEETADFNSEEEEEVVVEKIKKSKKEFFYALLLAAGMTYLLLESGYIDWN
jgi:DNA-binding transcriptional regulator WhiA|tara:strand:+ start:476 stop:817 length:342 start_codon:yes stop_codon:yes gene_type:complete